MLNAQTITQNSEQKRGELQIHIKQTSIAIQEDAAKNKEFQDGIIMENKRLIEEMAKLKELVAVKEKEKIDLKSFYEKEKLDTQLKHEA